MVTRTGQWQSPWGPTGTRGRGRGAGHEQQKGRDGCVRRPRRGRPWSSKEKGPSVPRGSPAAQAALGSAFRASVSCRPSLGDHLSLASLSCSSSRLRHEHCTQRSLRGVKRESGGAWVELKTPGCQTDPRSPHATSRSLWDPIQVCTQHTRPRETRAPFQSCRGRVTGPGARLDEGSAASGGNLADRAILSPRPGATAGDKQEALLSPAPCTVPPLLQPGSHAAPSAPRAAPDARAGLCQGLSPSAPEPAEARSLASRAPGRVPAGPGGPGCPRHAPGLTSELWEGKEARLSSHHPQNACRQAGRPLDHRAYRLASGWGN